MKKLLFLLFFVPVLLNAQSERALKLYGEGVKQFYNEEYVLALEFFNQSLALDTNFQIAAMNRGQTLMKLGLLYDAIMDFNTVIGLDSNYVDAYKELVICYINTHQYSEAIANLYLLIAFNPNIKAPYKQLGLCYYYTRKYELAEEAYGIYLEGNESDLEAWFQKGLCSYYYADYETAITDFSAVLDLDNMYSTAIEWRGKSYQKGNYIEKACSDWSLSKEQGLRSTQDYLDKYCTKGN